ncbi:MAG: serine hydrolase [Bacteroidales bacterium]|nr:serine hydrolase [Bacteroidales bacterium]
MKKAGFLVTVILSVISYFITVPLAAQPLNVKKLAVDYDKMLLEQFKPDETGCAALVAKDGQVIYTRAFGMANLELNVPMQPDMVFRIGSITKQFTAVAILQLMEQGKLSLQDDITKFIPDYPTQAYTITIEHLLTHTSGIKSYTNLPGYIENVRTDMKPDELINTFKNQPMEFAPGTKWNYNNSGYFLLGYIIEKVTGKSYPDYIQENFFTPLGMTSTCYGSDTKIIKNRAYGYQQGGDGVANSDYCSMTQPYSAGSIMSTVGDLFKWHQALYAGKLVKKETLEKAVTEYRLSNGKGSGYGYGWFLSQLQGSPTVEHGGGIFGYLTSSVYLPKEDVYVALFSNSTAKAPEFTALKMAAMAIGKPLVTTGITLDEATLDQYAGVYVNDAGREVTVTRGGNQLSATLTGAGTRKMFPVEKDKFLVDDAFMYATFSRDAAGKIVSFVSDDRGRLDEWKLTDKKIEEKKAITLSEATLDRYTGEFELQPGFTITFTREGNRLMTQATGQGKFEVFAESETKFFLKVVEAQVEFVADPDGKFNRMILYQGGQKVEGKRIK